MGARHTSAHAQANCHDRRNGKSSWENASGQVHLGGALPSQAPPKHTHGSRHSSEASLPHVRTCFIFNGNEKALQHSEERRNTWGRSHDDAGQKGQCTPTVVAAMTDPVISFTRIN